MQLHALTGVTAAGTTNSEPSMITRTPTTLVLRDNLCGDDI
jgi:hypothetical protein